LLIFSKIYFLHLLFFHTKNRFSFNGFMRKTRETFPIINAFLVEKNIKMNERKKASKQKYDSNILSTLCRFWMKIFNRLFMSSNVRVVKSIFFSTQINIFITSSEHNERSRRKAIFPPYYLKNKTFYPFLFEKKS
jgi:hypothetical protein